MSCAGIALARSPSCAEVDAGEPDEGLQTARGRRPKSDAETPAADGEGEGEASGSYSYSYSYSGSYSGSRSGSGSRSAR